MGVVLPADFRQPATRRRERSRDRRQRQARHDLRHLRSLRTDRRVALVLVGRCNARAQGCALRKAGKYQQGEPSVKYRGIFLNDEKPDLEFWVRAKYGERPSPVSSTATIANFNSQFYARIFEVILRLKGNYLWPAMWDNAFAEDDPENPRLADEYGIVMGTSHQEPMMRAQREWDWHQGRQLGNWNFATHEEALTSFWEGAVARTQGRSRTFTPSDCAAKTIPRWCRARPKASGCCNASSTSSARCLRDEVNPDVTRVPQVWTLYKEVQGYYENGLRVPDDVTLLWAEDNWGNVRRLPTAEERRAAGGAGVYYHFDYHGGPRSYQWINTNPIAKIWEQMSLAKQYGADRIWIVNVGHFKGYEFPTEYFLNLAWDSAPLDQREPQRIHAAVGRARVRHAHAPDDAPRSSPSTASTTAGASPSCWTRRPTAS